MDAPHFGYQMLAFGGAAPAAIAYPEVVLGHNSSGLRNMYGDGDDGETQQNDGYRTDKGKQGASGTTRDLSYFNLTCEAGVGCTVSAVTTYSVQFSDGSGSNVSGGHTWTLTWKIAGVTVGSHSTTGYLHLAQKSLTVQTTTAAQVLIESSMHTSDDGNAGYTEIFNYALDAASVKEAAGGPEIVGHTTDIDPDSPSSSLTAVANTMQTSFTTAAGDATAIKLQQDGYKDKYYRSASYDGQRVLVTAYFTGNRRDGSGGSRTVSLNVDGRGATTASSSSDYFQTTLTTNFILNAATDGLSGTNSGNSSIVMLGTASSGGGAFDFGSAIFTATYRNS